ncbi:FAD-binding domain-containing protein [Novosphingobium sp. Chol11]|uniref:FAD-binding domain-containing protein n=1 Tax=Novosphingobium sp. Chol11 TaxID=1385763 RepID=UPI0025DCBBBD|nr:FAD-binding domain-containing protein [Novosphingobium sp. Chol11]
MTQTFTPSRAAGLAALEAFLPQAGRRYAEQRNFDHGPGARTNISLLSPYIRYRLITEHEVIAKVLARHRFADAEKFVQEVCWRTYWKGWLEMRPSVWARYQVEAEDMARSADYAAACAGQTGIACFDAWAAELVETGYLHNHARMWFASLWIFTLGLPWQLGADFFHHHLLDGDPASNTLSWRWVAGLQTAGKTYLAAADNIAKYTGGRFNPAPFAHSAGPLPEAPVAPMPIAANAPLPDGAVGLLLTEEDLNPESLKLGEADIVAVAAAALPPSRAPAVNAFAKAALAEGLTRSAAKFRAPGEMLGMLGAESLIAWAAEHELEAIITPYAPIGPVRDRLDAMAPTLAAAGIALVPVRRAWDTAAWPHAGKGFFAFKDKIPGLISG